MNIHRHLIQGGEKGQSVLHAAKDIINKFFSIGVKNIVWRAFSLLFKCVVNRELLHACGDSPMLREEVRDGIIRPNIIGWDALNHLQ